MKKHFILAFKHSDWWLVSAIAKLIGPGQVRLSSESHHQISPACDSGWIVQPSHSEKFKLIFYFI